MSSQRQLLLQTFSSVIHVQSGFDISTNNCYQHAFSDRCVVPSERNISLLCDNPQGKHAEMVQNIKQILASQKLNDDDRLRLVMLYAVRYENGSNSSLKTFVDTLEQQGVAHAREKIDRLLDYAGARSAGNWDHNVTCVAGHPTH